MVLVRRRGLQEQPPRQQGRRLGRQQDRLRRQGRSRRTVERPFSQYPLAGRIGNVVELREL
jgi:hypothetical protein